MRIALDAMGGDHAPHEIVKGAVEAVRRLSTVTRIFLVGDAQAIKRELDACGGAPDKIEVRHASEVVEMDESPAQAVRRKKDSSINRAVDMVKAGEADAVVSAGNTGAIVVSATLKLRTLDGVDRPAIAAIMPTLDRPVILLDAGANAECLPRFLLQFAAMGTVYSRVIMGHEDPLVGLLSIGGEESKGNEMTKEVFQLLTNSNLNFRGNVEGHDIFKGKTDVVVCDGFAGNIVLKTSESVANAIRFWMKEEFTKNPIRIVGSLLLSGGLKAMKRRMDPEMYGGAPLLGVGGICIKAHGSSSNKAIFHAIRVAGESVHQHLNDAMVAEIKKLSGNG